MRLPVQPDEEVDWWPPRHRPFQTVIVIGALDECKDEEPASAIL